LDALAEWGWRRHVPQLDLAALTRAHVLDGHGNPDGMHWGWAAHTAVGEAMAKLITDAAPTAGRCEP
jgi:hypothetical protein